MQPFFFPANILTHHFRQHYVFVIFTDKAHAMKMRMERDAQFAEETFTHRIATCSRIANQGHHCSVCWPGHRGFAYGSSLQDKGEINNHFSTTYGCSFCRNGKGNVETEVEKTMSGIPPSHKKETASNTGTVPENSTVQYKRDVSYTSENLDAQITANSDAEDVAVDENKAETRQKMDDFGPWEDSTATECFSVPESESAVLVPHIFNFKLPSSNHCTCRCSDQQGDVTRVKHENILK